MMMALDLCEETQRGGKSLITKEHKERSEAASRHVKDHRTNPTHR